MDRKLLRVIEGAVKGDQDSYIELVRTKGKNILYIAMRLMGNKNDGEDAAQDAVIIMRESIKGLKNPESFEVWMYRLVYNVCMGAKRKMKNSLQHIELDSEEVQVPEDRAEFLPEEFVTDEEKRNELLAAVDQLPENYRMCIMLYYYEDMSYAEVAAVMGIKPQDVANNLNRAKKKLRYQLLATKEAVSLVPASAQADSVQVMGKNGALLAVPVLARAFALDEQVSISSSQVDRLTEVAAGEIIGGMVAVKAAASKLLSNTAVKVALGIVCVLGIVSFGAGHLPALFNGIDKAIPPSERLAEAPVASIEEPQDEEVALDEVLGEEGATRFIEIMDDDADQAAWTEYAQQSNFFYQGHFLTGQYRYTLYCFENKDNGNRVMVIERKDTAGAFKRVYSTDSESGSLPQGTEIVLAFEKWAG